MVGVVCEGKIPGRPPGDGGSSPPTVRKILRNSLGVEQWTHIPKVVGSIPTSATNPGVVFNGSIRGLGPCGRGSSPRTRTSGGYSSVEEQRVVTP